ncbi:terminase large subunit domain-containing protein [Cetobacterium sp.]|uniref:terminase large subunit domain-containing protein n=1 Tax=Cetobacterium sp. TaxID=2071632 RepID=UPI003F334C98
MALNYNICKECKECIKNHIDKKGTFGVKCIPIPEELMLEDPIYPLEKMLGKDVYDLLEEKEKIEIQFSKNKLLWAKEMLGWSTYNAERKFDQFYQKLMLTCTAKLRTMRLGRRMGKSEVVIVEAIQYAETNPGKTVLIIGPFQNLIDELFDRIAKLLDSQASALSSGYDRKRQPNVIRLPNGSQIKGFTTGMNGDSIRGQSGDRIYFDEASYIPPTAFRSVLALLMDNPNVSITATSTPSAVETKFKDW